MSRTKTGGILLWSRSKTLWMLMQDNARPYFSSTILIALLYPSVTNRAM
jgi:hypothetical protein